MKIKELLKQANLPENLKINDAKKILQDYDLILASSILSTSYDSDGELKAREKFNIVFKSTIIKNSKALFYLEQFDDPLIVLVALSKLASAPYGFGYD